MTSTAAAPQVAPQIAPDAPVASLWIGTTKHEFTVDERAVVRFRRAGETAWLPVDRGHWPAEQRPRLEGLWRWLRERAPMPTA